jgi:parallel beta-helix repeat protein
MAGPTMQRVSTLVSKDISNYLINQQTWGGILYNVKSYGAEGDDTTDDTTSIQNAINAGSTDGVPVFFPSGTYIVSQLSIPSGVKLWGSGWNLAIIKRKTNSTNTQFSVLKSTSASNIEICDLGIDGNKSNVTTSSHNLIFSTCSNVEIKNIKSYNAKGIGLFFENGTNETNKDYHSVTDSILELNEEDGMRVNNEKNLIIEGNSFLNNTQSGFIAYDSLSSQLDFMGNTASYNSNHGALFRGHVTNTPTSNNASFVTISGNTVHNNLWWGLAYQGSDATITGNMIKSNGTTVAHAGMLINGRDLTITGNYIGYNYFYGIDGGDATKITFTGNTVSNNGNTTDGGIGVNIESATLWVIGNNLISENGNSSSGTQIYVHGVGGDGVTTTFLGLTNNVSISGNTVTALTNQTGILVDPYCDDVLVSNNVINSSSSVLGLRFETNKGKAFGNGGTVFNNPTITADTTIVIPDSGDFFFVNGSTTITTIRTESSSTFNEKVSKITVTAAGSGYTSTPTVAITGGGGSGATATAFLDSGTVVAISVTNAGSGYTSTPAVAITGGGGSGATATAAVGVNNFSGRMITIKFISTVSVDNTGNIFLTATPLSATDKTQIQLVGSFGFWYEVSRSTVL